MSGVRVPQRPFLQSEDLPNLYEHVIKTLDRHAAEIQQDRANLFAKLEEEGQTEEHIHERMDAPRIENETVLCMKQIALLLGSAN